MLYREIIAVCSEIHTKHTNTLCVQNVELYIKTQSVPRSRHSPLIKTILLMMYDKKVTVSSESHTKDINAMYSPVRTLECQTWRYVNQPVGFKSLTQLPQLLRLFSVCDEGMKLRKL